MLIFVCILRLFCLNLVMVIDSWPKPGLCFITSSFHTCNFSLWKLFMFEVSVKVQNVRSFLIATVFSKYFNRYNLMVFKFIVQFSRGIVKCRSGFPKLESAAAAYPVCKVSSKIIFRAYTMHNRCKVTNISQWFAIIIVGQAVAMKNCWVFTEICMRLSF